MEKALISHWQKYMGISHQCVEDWVNRYRQKQDLDVCHTGNRTYSAELKRKSAEEYYNGEVSQSGIRVKYDVLSRVALRRWIKQFNANMERKDYDPKREVYKTETRRKTTKEERIELYGTVSKTGGITRIRQ